MTDYIIGTLVGLTVACALIGIFIILTAKSTDELDFMEEDRTDLDQEGGRRVECGQIVDKRI